MSALVADTHAVLWYVLDAPELSVAARERMEQAAQQGDPIFVPSISLVEIVYLVDKRRLPEALLDRIIDAIRDEEDVLALAPLDLRVVEALPSISREQVPDMPDRIIAATAIALGLPLISRDRRIAASVATIW